MKDLYKASATVISSENLAANKCLGELLLRFGSCAEIDGETRDHSKKVPRLTSKRVLLGYPLATEEANALA